jgi:putative copper export protein
MTSLTAPVATTARLRAAVVPAGLLLAVAVAVLALVATGGGPRPAPAGLRDAGTTVGWLVPVLRVLLDLGAVGTVGTLLAPAVLAPGRSVPGQVPVRAWALGWATAATTLGLVSAAEIVGAPLPAGLGTSMTLRFWWELPQGRALGLVVATALVVATLGRPARVVLAARARLLLAAALVSMGPLLATGHARTAAHHFLAAQLLLVHVVAATVWVGGLLALVCFVDRRDLPVALPRFSRLALACFVAVGVSGLAGAWVRIGVDAAAWGSTYGLLLLAKVAALGGLGAFGWWHRRRSVPAAVSGSTMGFARIAAAELALMAAAVGLAVALARTAAPVAAASRARPPHATTFATVDRALPAPSLPSLVLQSRPDAVLLTVLFVVLVGLLLAGRRAGVRPVLAPVAGTVLAGWALCGGLSAYSAALLSAQTLQILVLGVAVPLLLAPAASLLTPAQAAVLGRWLDPMHGLVLLLAVLTVLVTPWALEVSLRGPLLHLAVGLGALAGGALLVGSARLRAGADPTRLRTVLLVLAVVLVSHAALLYTRADLVAGAWFGALDWPWSDPRTDQDRAAGLVLAAAALVTAFAWMPGRGPRVRRAP